MDSYLKIIKLIKSVSKICLLISLLVYALVNILEFNVQRLVLIVYDEDYRSIKSLLLL